MEKKKGTLGEAFRLIAKGIALRQERAQASGKTTAHVLAAETRGDLYDARIQEMTDKIRWIESDLERNSQTLGEAEKEAKKKEIQTLKDKRQELQKERDRLYRDAEVPEGSSKYC